MRLISETSFWVIHCSDYYVLHAETHCPVALMHFHRLITHQSKVCRSLFPIPEDIIGFSVCFMFVYEHIPAFMIRGAATDSGPPGQHIHSGPPAGGGGGLYIIEIAIAFPSQSFSPLLPNQIILFQLLKSFSFVCNGKSIIFRFGFL